jgi:hypothetical protein
MPKSFVVAGSNDGVTWVQMDARSGLSAFTSLSTQTFTLTQTTLASYTYLRLIVTSIALASSQISIDEWRLYTTIVAACSATTCAASTYARCAAGCASVCCGAGTFLVDGLSTACALCPAGTYGFGNATVCTTCAVGQIL